MAYSNLALPCISGVFIAFVISDVSTEDALKVSMLSLPD